MSLLALKRSFIPLSFCFACLPQLVAAQQTSSQPESLVAATVARVTEQTLTGNEDLAERQWLANAPRLAVMHWQTDDATFGSDESEVTLELDFLSPGQRELLQSSEQLQQTYLNLRSQQLRLEVSRLIRQLFWQYQQAQIELDFAEQAAAQLDQLHRVVVEQVAAGAKTNYARLISEQRWRAALSQVKQQQLVVRDLANRWQRLTGQTQVPSELVETVVQRPTASFNQQHPLLVALDLQWQLTLAEARQTARAQTSWTVATGFKHISTATDSENQWGLGLTIPITFSQSLSPFEMLALKQQQNAIVTELRQTRMALDNDIAEASSQLERTQLKLQAAAISADLSEQVIAELEQLYQQQQLDTQLYIDRFLEQLMQQKIAALTQAELGLAKALLNQAQGIAL